MQFRHEVKHEISQLDMLVLRQRLKVIMQPNPHAINGRYEIRSLYFDTLDDKALREKLDGVYIREKYRIRIYNHDPSVIHLERKYKQGGLGFKNTALLNKEQAAKIALGDLSWMQDCEDEVIQGFLVRLRNEGLKPRTIVDYTREPFVYGPGNVRITLDYNLRTAPGSADFLDPDCPTIPVPDSPCILEVKWDDYLPDIIRDIIQLPDRHSSAFSKYAACRMLD